MDISAFMLCYTQDDANAEGGMYSYIMTISHKIIPQLFQSYYYYYYYYYNILFAISILKSINLYYYSSS